MNISICNDVTCYNIHLMNASLICVRNWNSDIAQAGVFLPEYELALSSLITT